jgi:hypothetical protein
MLHGGADQGLQGQAAFAQHRPGCGQRQHAAFKGLNRIAGPQLPAGRRRSRVGIALRLGPAIFIPCC